MREPGRKTDVQRPFFGQAPVDMAIAALAATQHAVFGLGQLLELGLSERAIRHRVAAGRLHRIHHGVYSLVPRQLLTREGLYMAAVLACGPGAVLSHRSAAVVHGLKDWGGGGIDVTVPGRTGRRHDGLMIHRSTTLTPQDTTVVNNIPCTTVARTLFDLAEVVNRRGLEIAFDRSEQQGELNIEAVQAQLRRSPTRPASSRINALLNEHYIGATLTDSELEEAMFALCRRINAPQPQLQYWILLPDGGAAIRADFAWPSHKLIVEADGVKYHNTHQRREHDNDRDQRLAVHNWRVIHTTKRQITRRAHVLERRLIALLGS